MSSLREKSHNSAYYTQKSKSNSETKRNALVTMGHSITPAAHRVCKQFIIVRLFSDKTQNKHRWSYDMTCPEITIKEITEGEDRSRVKFGMNSYSYIAQSGT